MTVLAPAFTDQAKSSQHVFRAVMDALARPGSLSRITEAVTAPPPLNAAAAAVALTLLDFETAFWLDPMLADCRDAADWLRFHTGATMAHDPSQAAFAFIADTAATPALETFALGTPDYPDRSATLVLQVETFAGGTPMILTGPGVDGERALAAAPLPKNFIQRLGVNRALFPRGVDLILATHDTVAALPRSVRVRERDD